MKVAIACKASNLIENSTIVTAMGELAISFEGCLEI